MARASESMIHQVEEEGKVVLKMMVLKELQIAWFN